MPFGGVEHDWAALELGAWIAAATGAPLNPWGAAGLTDRGPRARRAPVPDASQRPAVRRDQRAAGRSGGRPRGRHPGRHRGGAARGRPVRSRWREEGLGPTRSEIARAAPAPVLFVRRGTRPGALAPREDVTRFSWSAAGMGARIAPGEPLRERRPSTREGSSIDAVAAAVGEESLDFAGMQLSGRGDHAARDGNRGHVGPRRRAAAAPRGAARRPGREGRGRCVHVLVRERPRGAPLRDRLAARVRAAAAPRGRALGLSRSRTRPDSATAATLSWSARIADRAQAGEILVSESLKEYTASDPSFEFELARRALLQGASRRAPRSLRRGLVLAARLRGSLQAHASRVQSSEMGSRAAG